MEQQRLKIMIVDDEESARKMIASSVDWQAMNMEIIAEAVSGLEALALMEEQVPDIMFTDIKMPYMSGLELSQLAAARYPHMKIVILTAFKDFEYAKKSISIGVSHFLLKPINRTELQSTVLKLREQIEEEKRKWFEYDHLKEILSKNRAVLRERFLLECLESGVPTEETKRQLDYYFADGIADYIQVTLLEAVRQSGDLSEEERILSDMRTLEFVKSYLKDDGRVEALTDKSHRLVLLSYSGEIQMSALCEQISRSVYQTSGIEMAFGIGNAYPGVEQMGKSYQEAQEALKYSRYAAGDSIVVYQDDLHVENTPWNPSQNEIEDVKFYIKAGLLEPLEEILPTLYRDGEGRLIDVEYARMLSMTLLSASVNSANEIGLPIGEIFGANSEAFLDTLTGRSAAELETKTIRYVQKLTASVASFRSDKSKSTLWDILQYIQREMGNPQLSLGAVAAQYHMNDSYLSRIFKKELGFSFSKYLNRLRMERAIQLLGETDMKAYQIGEAVGIPDAYYFSNCFKKYTGKSIRDYKKNMTAGKQEERK